MSETQEDRREAAATRRRWVSLAEAVAVAGLIIGALTLWLSWSDKRDSRAEKASEQAEVARERARLELTATAENDGDSLALKDARHDLAEVTVTFPKALGVGPQSPSGDPMIDSAWFREPLLALTDGGADTRAGRLPVLLTIRYWDADAARTTTGIYDVIWSTEGRMLRGRSLKLEGLRLRQRGGNQAALDAAWARLKP